MKNLIIIILVFFGMIGAKAQVGIANTNPQASLDISASNPAAPSNTDGILVPRIDEFPATDPVAASDGLMVFATGSGSVSKGFYYWDEGTTSWVAATGAKQINELTDGRSDSDGSNDGSSVFLGLDAGISDNLTDNRSVGIGFEALRMNTNGRDNIGIGNQTLRSNLNGFSNIAIGTGVLFTTTGNSNIGIGFNALHDNTTASDNIGIGFASLENNTTGVNNVGVGSQTLSNNTLGFFNNAYGRHSLQSNIDGNGNTAMGHGSLRDNTSGSNNAAFGNSAGDNVNGDNNVFVGRGAGVGLSGSTNTGNVVIGNEAGSGANYDNRLYIDNSNTSSPLIYGEFDTNLLRVNGTLDINNQYQLPLNDGAASQFLQTDGAGNVSWQTSASTTVGIKLTNTTHNTSYSLSPTANTFMFDTVEYNVGGGTYNSATGGYTVPVAGIYNISLKMMMNFDVSPAQSNVMIVHIRVNGTVVELATVQNSPVAPSITYSQNYPFEFTFDLNVNDVIDIRYFMANSGGSPLPRLNGDASGSPSTISISKI